MHPYRAADVPQPERDRRPFFDRDLAGVYSVLWVFALARVVTGFALRRRFGVDLAIATGAVCLLPLLARARK